MSGARAAYPYDLTDDERALIEQLIPASRPGGRPRKVGMCEVVDAIADMLPGLREEARRRAVDAAQEQVRQAEEKLAKLQATGRGPVTPHRYPS
jgi:hypothetical protein